MPVTETPMRALYRKLGSAGIPVSFAKRMLPSWWDDEVAEDPAGLQQAQLYLARAFNLDVRSLAENDIALRFRAVSRKFKRNKNVSEDAICVGANYATGIARIALSAYPGKQSQVVPDPVLIRNEILQRHSCVSLPALLEWCHNAAIPVLYIEAIPGKKMTGLVVRDKDRFAIVLSKRGRPAHLLFHLAHEIGHIGAGHLREDGFVADELIDSASSDTDEREADKFAVCLLNGSDLRYTAGEGVELNARALHSAAVIKGAEQRVDPGHIIANYGFNRNRFAVAHLALQKLNDPASGGELINAAFFESLPPHSISSDQLELLHAATGFSG